MLEFYQEQQKKQDFLAIFLDIYQQDDPHKGILVALTQTQSSRLKFLIEELKNPASIQELSRKEWADYCKSYRDQQRLLASIVTAESVASYLPDLVLPATQMEEKGILEQGAVGLQSDDSINSVPEPTFFSQQLPTPTVNNNGDGSTPQSSLVGSHSFFSLSEKTDENSKAGSDKYARYEQRVQRLKERKSSLSPEEKLELRRLSNALSAHNSRANKRNYIQELETSITENTAKNKALKVNCLRLAAEQRVLKEELSKLMVIVAQVGVDPEGLLQYANASAVEEEDYIPKTVHLG